MIYLSSLISCLLFSFQLLSDSIWDLYSKGLATVQGDTLVVEHCLLISSLEGMDKIPDFSTVRNLKITAQNVSGIKAESLKSINDLQSVEIHYGTIEASSYSAVLMFNGIERKLIGL